MTALTVKYIKEIKQSIHDCLKHFFVGGNTRTLSGSSIKFYDCELKYGIEKLADAFTGKPLIIVFSPTEYGDSKVLKCKGKFNHELPLRSRVVVKVGTSKPCIDTSGNAVSAKALAHEVWGQLFVVISTQEDRFCSYGVSKISIDSSPEEIDSNESQEVLLTGMFSYQCEMLLGHDAFVAP